MKVKDNHTYPTISARQFRQIMTQQKATPFLVVFTADWLGEGTLLDNIMEQLSEKYTSKFDFYRIDIEQSNIAAKQYGLRQVPAVLLFKDGEMADHFIGILPQRVIEERILRLMI